MSLPGNMGSPHDENDRPVAIVFLFYSTSMSKTKLCLLGTSTPNYETFAQQCAAVIVDDVPYLIDCGDGAMPRIMQAYRSGESALSPHKLSRLFLTHLHPDHTAGLAGIIISAWVLQRTAALHIYGPAGTQRLVDGILAAYADGLALHRNGKAPLAIVPLDVVVHEYTAGRIYTDERMTVEAFSVSHGVVESYGLRLVSADKTIVHSGDTCPQQTVIDAARGCDILLHEVYCAASLHVHHAEWHAYHQAVHTSSIQLAEMACEIRPKLLVLNHQLIWGDYTEADLMAEITAIYDGDVVFGRDLDVFE